MNEVVTTVKMLALFTLTAGAEILGCYATAIFVNELRWWPWLPVSIVALAAFALLLTLQPFAAGRSYATYGGIYIACSILWLWKVNGETPTRWDLIGAAIGIIGTLVIVLGNRVQSH